MVCLILREEAIDWSKETYQVEFIDIPAAEKAKWDELLTPITTDWIKAVSDQGFPAESIVEDIRALIEKYSSE